MMCHNGYKLLFNQLSVTHIGKCTLIYKYSVILGIIILKSYTTYHQKKKIYFLKLHKQHEL